MATTGRPNKLKWFLIGFGIRECLGIVVLLLAIRNFEAGFLLLADPPTILVLTLAEWFLPRSVFAAIVSAKLFYVPMNILGGVLWVQSLLLSFRYLAFRFQGLAAVGM